MIIIDDTSYFDQDSIVVDKPSPSLHNSFHPKEPDDLRTAILMGDTQKAKAVLTGGMDINQKCLYDETPLMWVSQNGDVEMARLLLKMGAHPDIKNAYGRTALMFAAQHGYAGLAQLLIDHGASIEGCDRAGHTAMTLAQAAQQPSIMRILEEAAAQEHLRMEKRAADDADKKIRASVALERSLPASRPLRFGPL